MSSHHVAGDHVVIAAVECRRAALAPASAPSMTGSRAPGDPPHALELLAARVAKTRQGPSWCSPRMFTESAPAARPWPAHRGPGRGTITIGGSSDRAAKDWHGSRGLAVFARGDDGHPRGEMAEHLAEPGLVQARHVWLPYALPRSIDWDSWAEDTSSIPLASGRRLAWFRILSSSRSVCEGSWCESRRRFTPVWAATCTA